MTSSSRVPLKKVLFISSCCKDQPLCNVKKRMTKMVVCFMIGLSDMKIYASPFMKSFRYQASFKLISCSIQVSFDMEYPFTANVTEGPIPTCHWL